MPVYLAKIALIAGFIATWKQEYSARATYGSAIGGWPATQSLNPAFWHKVTEVFVSNDALFQTFNSLKTRGVEVLACTGDCKTTTICNLRALRAENNCVSHHLVLENLILWNLVLKIVATPGINFRRAEDEIDSSQRGHVDHCEGTGVRTIFENIALKAVDISNYSRSMWLLTNSFAANHGFRVTS